MSVEEELLLSAARLYSLGVSIDLARQKMFDLAQQGASFSSPEMVSASRQLQKMEQQWQELEQQHLAALKQRQN